MPRPLFRSAALVAALAAALAAPLPLPAEGLAGAYLAARAASSGKDYAAAARYYQRALALDPANAALLEGAVVALMGLGDLDAAAPVARRLREVTGGRSSVAELVLLADQARREDWEGILADYNAGREAGPLVDGLARGWSLLALGRVSDSLAAFDAVIANRALAAFGAYHKALALATAGDFEGAEALLAAQEQDGQFALGRRGVLVWAEVLAQLDRADDALALLDRAFGADPEPVVARMRARLAADEPVAFDRIASPVEGIAEVFYSVANVLDTEAGDAYVLMHSRAAEALSPRHSDAMLLTASILERQGQYALATEAYGRIPPEDPAFHMAEMGRAEALFAAGESDEALAVLRALAASHPGLPDVHRALGDLLRRLDRFDEASQAYDAAIAALPVEDRSHWVLYYLRGITHERTGRWDRAEADFRKALALETDQPDVLNYLGYSYLELGSNFEEALAMIERAAAARPDDGYIIDSLGWAFFRLGRYAEAVAPMERAAALMPTDPIVNDHLGDVYWMVGRHTEARFQWRRALSFYVEGETTDVDPDRIRRKLEVGLDQVRIEEGAAPAAMADDQGG
jgi:tetratricopeptide (TPR) repeat protein